MRDARRQQLPAFAAFVVLALVAAGTLANAPPALGRGLDVPAAPRVAFELPGPGQDADLDGWSDAVDLWDGNTVAAVLIGHGGIEDPVFLIATDDDQYRTGRGRPLQWAHVADMDALDPTPGSDRWVDANIRTGAVVRGVPNGDEAILVVDVAEDTPPLVHVEVWDRDGRRYATGEVRITARAENGTTDPIVWREGDDASGEAWLMPAPSPTLAAELARKWAPTIHFDSDEAIHPASGASLQAVDGFFPVRPDLRPWSRGFNNGRDGYRLLLDHFNDDGVIDHRDVAARLAGLAPLDYRSGVVHAQVAWAQDLRVVVQYWFLYPYNYVVDARGRDIEELAHKGDREFVQLVFPDMEAARNGMPSHAVFSQHYRGVAMPWHEGTDWDVYVARGSHASYPLPGDDRRATPALVGYHDRFDGRGATWIPGNYTIELLDQADWTKRNLWGPLTRFSRDLGIPSSPTFRYDFRYPYVEPFYWQEDLPELTWEVAERLYEGST